MKRWVDFPVNVTFNFDCTGRLVINRYIVNSSIQGLMDTSNYRVVLLLKNTILKDNFPVSETKGKTDFISNYINIGNQNQSENKQKNL